MVYTAVVCLRSFLSLTNKRCPFANQAGAQHRLSQGLRAPPWLCLVGLYTPRRLSGLVTTETLSPVPGWDSGSIGLSLVGVTPGHWWYTERSCRTFWHVLVNSMVSLESNAWHRIVDQ